MSNKELIQEIYEICLSSDYQQTFSETVIDLIDKEAPALVAHTFKEGWENPKGQMNPLASVKRDESNPQPPPE